MRVLIVLISAAAVAACAAPTPSRDPVTNPKAMKAAVGEYLRDHGDFCLGKFTWPIVVTERARKAGSNDAVQMPVLERLGLVTSTIDPSHPATQVYSLSDLGRKFYVSKDVVTRESVDTFVEHPGDLCAVKLQLDQIVSWTAVRYVDGHAQTSVKFTYAIENAAPWAEDPQLRRVFPWLDRILASERHLQLEQLFTWSNGAWTAVLPGS
jgi:hypothetical protein